MGVEMPDNTSTLCSLVRGMEDLVGAGVYLLMVGFLLEGATLGIQQRVSFPLSLTVETQVFLTVPCAAFCLFGVTWFNCSLNLITVHLLHGRKELITHGPFSYVRHPLYATLMITMPPLAIIWRSDLLFFIPWVLIVIVSHYVVRFEERGLIEIFGEDYERYKRHVPALLPFKGSGGRRCRVKGS
jgi:protein-S-isoprenylcysteine O-methyltransferase Ste14